MDDKLLKALKYMQECIHELRREVESLEGDNVGIQIGRSTFDYMDSAVNELESEIEEEKLMDLKAEKEAAEFLEHLQKYGDKISEKFKNKGEM